MAAAVMLFFTSVMLIGLLLTLFSSLWLIFAGMLLFSAGFSPPTRSPAAGLARARVAPKVRHRLFICLAITRVQHRRDARRRVLA